jgi:hypothetical protein
MKSSLQKLNLLLTLQMSSQRSLKSIQDIVKDVKELEQFNQFLQKISEMSWPPPPKMENVEDIRRWEYHNWGYHENVLVNSFKRWKKEIRTQAIRDLNPVIYIQYPTPPLTKKIQKK